MPADPIHFLLSNAWSTFLVVLFFGGSIFVHELGHFLVARRRGVKVERFSIGFGSAIWSRRGRDGVEYRISWIPFGGYVLLPQLADLGPIEGKSEAEAAKLPPVSYTSKMLVFVAGAAFNMLFAFALACVIWIVGQPENAESASTEVGYVAPTLDLADGSHVPSPASEAGLRVGDVIKAIDGRKVSDWSDLNQTMVTSSGRDEKNRPRVVLTLERAGRQFNLTLSPVLADDDRIRRIGISPGFPLIVYGVEPASAADQAGIKAGDEILAVDGTPMRSFVAWEEYLDGRHGAGLAVRVRRAGREITLPIPARPTAKPEDGLVGLSFSMGLHLTYPSPFAQLRDQIAMTFRTFGSLLNPHSDIGLSKLAGPIGIVHMFNIEAENGLRSIFVFTILVNVNLAIFNLMPIPVLDGGQMLFATIGRLRRRALPANFIVATQSVFMVLLFSMIIYVSYFNVRHWARDVQADHAAAEASKH